MIHELRIDTAFPGRLPAWIRYFRDVGIGLLDASGLHLKGVWSSEFGALNRLYTLWEYPEIQDLHTSASALKQSEAWRSFTDEGRALLAETETHYLVPLRPLAPIGSRRPLYDFRIYDLRPFCAGKYLRLLADALTIREAHSANYAAWRPLDGRNDRIFTLWPYDSLQHRSDVRDRLGTEPVWQDFARQVYPLLLRQRSSLLRPVEI